jgi:hypothetical protein
VFFKEHDPELAQSWWWIGEHGEYVLAVFNRHADSGLQLTTASSRRSAGRSTRGPFRQPLSKFSSVIDV